MYAGFSYYIYSLKKMPQPEIRSTISVLIKLKIFCSSILTEIFTFTVDFYTSLW